MPGILRPLQNGTGAVLLTGCFLAISLGLAPRSDAATIGLFDQFADLDHVTYLEDELGGSLVERIGDFNALGERLPQLDILLVPDLSVLSVEEAHMLGFGLASELQDFLVGGGGMIVLGSERAVGASFLSGALDILVVGGVLVDQSELDTVAAVGTPFADGPLVLNGSPVAGITTPPAGAVSFYSAGGGALTSVFGLTYGQGHVVYLGYNWSHGADPDWASVLGAAVEYASTPVPEPSAAIELALALGLIGASRSSRRTRPRGPFRAAR